MLSLDESSRFMLLDDIPWGTHFCLFYETKEDLIDILIPYFKAGLENNEYCMWVTSEPLNKREAENAIRKATPDFDKYLKRKQIEIISYSEWYTLNNEFDSDRVLDGWVDKCNLAQQNGFEGLRLTGNTFWLEEKDWNDFRDYEEEVNRVIGNYRMKAICTYSLQKCGPFELLDVIKNHQFALIRRDGSWESFKSIKQIELERKLKESERRLKKFMDSATDGFVIFDSKLNYIDVNEVSQQTVGRSKEELIGKNILDIIPNLKETGRYEKYLDVIKTGNSFSTDDVIYNRQDRSLESYFSVRAFKVGDDLGVIFTDITESKKKEEEIRLQSEIIDSMSEGVYLIKLDNGTIFFTNPAFEEMFGYNPGEMIGKNVAIVNAPTDKTPEEMREAIMGILKETGEWHGEVLNVKKDGTSFWCYANVSLFDHPEYGTVIVSVHTDITERKKIEQELKESEEKFRLIAEQTLIGICIIQNEELKYLNRAFGEIHEYTVEEMYERSLNDLINDIHQDDVHLVIENKVLREVGDKGIHHFLFRIKTKSGKMKWLDNTSIGIQYDGGDALLSTIIDITELKDIENKLNESTYELGERVKELTCLYELSKLIEDPTMFLEDIFKGTLILIPPAFQFPDITTARITYNGREHKLSNFEETEWKLSTKVRIDEKPLLIEINYLNKKRFLKEEHDLIREIGIRLKATLEEKEAQNRLRESEEKYRIGFKSSTDGIASADMEGTFIDFNNTFIEMLGYTREELFKLNFREITPQKWHDMEDNLLFSQLADGKDSGIYEKEYIRKDGTVFPVDVRFWIIKDKQGDPVSMWCIVRDITERKKAEEKINNLAKFPSENPHPVLRLDRNKIIYVNSSGKGLLNVEIGEEIPSIIQEEVNRVFETKSMIEFDIELKDKIYSFAITPIKNQNYLNLYGMDITERKKAEEKINDLAKFPSENPHPVLRLDRNKVIYVNSSGKSLLNVEIGEEIPSIILEEVNKVFETNSTINFDIELKNRIYSFTITPIENQNYLNLYGMDITERKKAEEKITDLARFPSENPHPILRLNRNKVMYVNNSGNYLLNVEIGDEIPNIIRQEVKKAFDSNSVVDLDIELKDRIYSFTITPFRKKNYVNLYGMDITENIQAEQKLKDINKLKSEFLRRASHELKTPLISIKGFSDLILALHKDQISSEIISKLNEINRGCERLQNIINNLLKTSRLESPELRPNVQYEDLSFLIKFCVHELQSLLQSRNQTLNLNISDGQYGIFEKEEIHDVISNLLTNAIKYTPPYGNISINTEEKGDFIMISVKDNGIGFTEEQEGRIFKQFGKIERYGQGLDLGIDGTGLGLYISKKIVESNGGEIWMESEGKNKGSTFFFTIPSVK